MLAILLEMTWTLSSWAIIPVAAVCSARMENPPDPGSARNFGELVDGVAAHVALLLQERRDLRVSARDFDHARHFDDAAHVRLLDRTLHDARSGRRLRGDAVRRRKQAG